MKTTAASLVPLLAPLIIASAISGTSLAASLSIPQAGKPEQQTTGSQTGADKQQSPPAEPAVPQLNPNASSKYHVGDKGVTAPKLIHSVEPEFSEEARKKKVRGYCLVSLTVDAADNPKDAHLIKSSADALNKKLELDENCIKAVDQYRFKPGTYQGKPVPVELKVEVNFQIF